jgi:hypothetical protein
MRFETWSALALEAAFDGGRLTSDGGLLWLARMEEELGLCEAISECVPEWRTRKARHSLASLVRQRVFQIACGYEDQNDSDSLREDPLLKLVCGSLPESDPALASQPTFSRMENAATRGSCHRIAQALLELYLSERGKDGPPKKVLLDFDSTDDPTHGDQEGSYYHGYYEQHMYHPLLVFDGESGHLITALLRAGNTHASNSCVALLKRLVCWLRERWPAVEIEIRADGGFAVPAIYDYCEEEDITYTVGLITNPRLQEMAEGLLDEATERYETEGEKVRLFSEGLYQAGSWEKKRRVIYKAEAMEQGTNTRFVVTTREDKPRDLYEFYARRGERELDQGLQAPHEGGSVELPSVHRQPIPATVARGGLLADGRLEEEAGGKRGAQEDATGHLEARFDQDRRQGQGALHEGPFAPGLGASGTKFMARSFESLRRRS